MIFRTYDSPSDDVYVLEPICSRIEKFDDDCFLCTLLFHLFLLKSLTKNCHKNIKTFKNFKKIYKTSKNCQKNDK